MELFVHACDTMKNYRGLGSDPMGKKPLENPPENQLEISYSEKSPKIGSSDMS